MGYDRDQFRDDFQQAEGDAKWAGWRILKWIVLALIVLFAAVFIIKMVTRPLAVAEKITEPGKIISNYEEFQEIYNTCQKVDADLKTICGMSDGDAMFSQFSKGAMITQKRQLMTRWVNEYNAKSKMYTRSLWKSPSLPYQLNEEHFPNYNCR